MERERFSALYIYKDRETQEVISQKLTNDRILHINFLLRQSNYKVIYKPSGMVK